MAGTSLFARTDSVRLARWLTRAGSAGEGGCLRRGGRRCFVGNLSYKTSWRGLKDHCKQAGTVVYSDVKKEPSTGRSKGCGTVEFSTAMEAAMAIQMLHDSELDGRRISVGAPSAKGRIGQGAPLGPEVLAELSRRL